MQELINSAIDQAIGRWGTSGWAGAAAARLSCGRIMTSVYVDSPNDAANLCHETGAICEAHRLNRQVVACACVSRETATDDFAVLSPCGICQERLAFWGLDVEVAVPAEDTKSGWSVRKLAELQPYYWAKTHHKISVGR